MTLAQIVLAAQAAANKAASATDALAQQTIKLEEFATSGIDRADFATFETSFNAQFEMYQVFSQQDSPATLAAKKAAQAAAPKP
jgi:hypothetical protein